MFRESFGGWLGGDVRRPSRCFVVIGAALVPIPLAGWVVAQTFVDRVAQTSEWSAAYIHALTVSSFAVLLCASAVVNLTILIRRLPDRPVFLRHYPAAQASVIILGMAWLGCLAVGSEAMPVEVVIGSLIAVASVVTFIILCIPDPLADLQRLQRVIGRRQERTAVQVRGRRVMGVIIGVTIIGVAALVQLVPVESIGCAVEGKGNVNGAIYLYTSCGDMAVDSTRVSDADASRALYAGTDFDITTRGYVLGIPPLRLIIDLQGTDFE